MRFSVNVQPPAPLPTETSCRPPQTTASPAVPASPGRISGASTLPTTRLQIRSLNWKSHPSRRALPPRSGRDQECRAAPVITGAARTTAGKSGLYRLLVGEDSAPHPCHPPPTESSATARAWPDRSSTLSILAHYRADCRPLHTPPKTKRLNSLSFADFSSPHEAGRRFTWSSHPARHLPPTPPSAWSRHPKHLSPGLSSIARRTDQHASASVFVACPPVVAVSSPGRAVQVASFQNSSRGSWNTEADAARDCGDSRQPVDFNHTMAGPAKDPSTASDFIRPDGHHTRAHHRRPRSGAVTGVPVPFRTPMAGLPDGTANKHASRTLLKRRRRRSTALVIPDDLVSACERPSASGSTGLLKKPAYSAWLACGNASQPDSHQPVLSPSPEQIEQRRPGGSHHATQLLDWPHCNRNHGLRHELLVIKSFQNGLINGCREPDASCLRPPKIATMIFLKRRPIRRKEHKMNRKP
ncbi:hypothetical protein HPP92_025798 [Vanilla planifolia]|uniref:Uncharacterized protein n=1 Tax=Vanilla planifolia TaxID=51239 RepID=A0A835U8U5_VANPL|nr:hypothetical protein HPP92_026092 [Vanilla planifolia]KAG0452249.1 hypothetical protein HPP92_025798 [Vanilla planifolia]